MLLTFVVLYLLFTLIVGIYAARRVKNSSDYAVAGRKLPLYMVSCGLFATWFGSETMMGASGEFVENGILGIIEDPLGASLCLFMIGMFYAKPLYRLNLLTFSDYFKRRYGRKAEFISALIMIPTYFGWIAAQLVAMAFVLEIIAGIPFEWGVLTCALVVVIYTYFGGMWSVSVTDTLQTVLILLGLLILFWVVWKQVGGWQAIQSHVPSEFWRFTPQENSWESWSLYFAAWITIGWGSIPQQDVFQRVLGANSAKTAVNGAYIAGGMYLTVAMLPLLIALCAEILYPEITNKQMLLPHMVLNHMNLGLQILTFGALLSAILSTCSGAILAPATVFAENILKPLFPMRDSQLLKAMRGAVIGISVCSSMLALQKQHIFELVAESSAFSLVALFVPLTAGLYWRKSSSWGATLSMLAGTAVWGYFEWFPSTYPSLLYGLAASTSGLILGSLSQKVARA